MNAYKGAGISEAAKRIMGYLVEAQRYGVSRKEAMDEIQRQLAKDKQEQDYRQGISKREERRLQISEEDQKQRQVEHDQKIKQAQAEAADAKAELARRQAAIAALKGTSPSLPGVAATQGPPPQSAGILGLSDVARGPSLGGLSLGPEGPPTTGAMPITGAAPQPSGGGAMPWSAPGGEQGSTMDPRSLAALLLEMGQDVPAGIWGQIADTPSAGERTLRAGRPKESKWDAFLSQIPEAHRLKPDGSPKENWFDFDRSDPHMQSVAMAIQLYGAGDWDPDSGQYDFGDANKIATDAENELASRAQEGQKIDISARHAAVAEANARVNRATEGRLSRKQRGEDAAEAAYPGGVVQQRTDENYVKKFRAERLGFGETYYEYGDDGEVLNRGEALRQADAARREAARVRDKLLRYGVDIQGMPDPLKNRRKADKLAGEAGLQ